MHRVQVDTSPSPALLGLLEAHIPYSLPLLRRLQFTKIPGGRTQDTRILLASAAAAAAPHSSSARADGGSGSDGSGDGSGIDPSAPFAAAYVDFSRGPETEVWMYSSLEKARARGVADDEQQPVETAAAEVDLAIAVLREIKAQRDAYVARGGVCERDTVLLGALSEELRLAVVAATTTSGIDAIATPIVLPEVGIYDKWLMRLETLPDVPDPTTATTSSRRDEEKRSREALHWTQVQKSDIAMILSRTSIPRKE